MNHEPLARLCVAALCCNQRSPVGEDPLGQVMTNGHVEGHRFAAGVMVFIGPGSDPFIEILESLIKVFGGNVQFF